MAIVVVTSAFRPLSRAWGSGVSSVLRSPALLCVLARLVCVHPVPLHFQHDTLFRRHRDVTNGRTNFRHALWRTPVLLPDHGARVPVKMYDLFNYTLDLVACSYLGPKMSIRLLSICALLKRDCHHMVTSPNSWCSPHKLHIKQNEYVTIVFHQNPLISL